MPNWGDVPVKFARRYEVVRAALRGPRAISLTGCSILAIISVVGSFATDSNLGRGIGLSLTLGLLLTAASGIVLLAARMTVLPKNQVKRASPWIALAVFAVAGAVRPITATLVGSVVDVDIPLDMHRVVQATVAGVVGLTFVAVALDLYDRYKETIRDLELEVDELNYQRAHSQANLNRVAAVIDSTMIEMLRSSLVMTRAELHELELPPVDPVRVRQAAAALSDLNERSVRPMSHSLYRNESLADAEFDPYSAIPRQHYFRPRISDRLSELFMVSPFHPIAMPIIVAMTAIFIAVSGVGWAGGIVVLGAESLVLGLSLAAASRILGFRRRQRLGRLMRALAVLGLVAVSIFASLSVTWFLTLKFGSFDPAVAVAGVIWMFMTWLLLAALSSSHSERARAIGVLQATRSTRQWELDVLNREIKGLRSSRASYLHGKIQSRLTLVAVHLKRTASSIEAEPIESGSALAAIGVAVVELDSLINEIEQLMEQSVAPPNLRAGLESIRSAWLGIVDISYVGTQSIERYSDASRALGTAITEVVAEAVTNAAKHGNSRNMAVTFEYNKSSILLSAEDDGRGLRPLIGAPDSIERILGPLATCVIREGRDGGAHLLVSIPIS